MRRLALELDDAVEIPSEGFDFRVRGKGFVWSYPERVPGSRRVIRTDVAVLYVGDEAEKQALLRGEPELFFTARGYEPFPLVMVRLELVGTDRLAELVGDAWRMRVDEAGPG
ncbi:hypothetical protein C8E95_3507 [Pseudonocardia autotrophica]|uniref:MmcQ/YjbR family DNA-binding protein n=2 Tax=Pseudonocardia TaxID=1847 RepID=A0A1Y2MYT0_PSEAH|nr:hypothetical protein BG845_03023 [Pseudonocardia autotrophica]TDN74385.1 hypothetical protein C8E95_3507 [Pseudonocardia autotrophica]BBG05151.1 hypothetical protein Pdca_63600 [Pseudonocardia autotrophica]GEC28130.1 hypothetical protein PSA01_51590 [Pseudonocardia saturnea]